MTEVKVIQMLGGDAVGMSTAQEALVAGYCGIDVFALALITNEAVTDYDSEDFPNHEEVIEIANKRAQDVESLILNFVPKI